MSRTSKAEYARRLREAILYDVAEIRKQLREECDYQGGVRAFGRLARISAGHISRVLRGEKDPGEKVLAFLGFEVRTFYVKTSTSRERAP